MEIPRSGTAGILVSSLNFKLKSSTLLSSLLKVKFTVEFCLYIESISNILSAAWRKTNSSTPSFRFLGDFLGMVGVRKSDRLEFESSWIVGTGAIARGGYIFYHIL